METNKIELARRLCLRCRDVMVLTGYGKSTSYGIMDECRREFGGAVANRPDCITTDSLFRYFRTTRLDYLRSLGQ